MQRVISCNNEFLPNNDKSRIAQKIDSLENHTSSLNCEKLTEEPYTVTLLKDNSVQNSIKRKIGETTTELSPSRLRKKSHVDKDMYLNTGILETLLTKLCKHNDSWPFLSPVSREKVPDYDLVKNAMDLDTMRSHFSIK